jgi:hypothetical protein
MKIQLLSKSLKPYDPVTKKERPRKTRRFQKARVNIYGNSQMIGGRQTVRQRETMRYREKKGKAE